MRRLPCPRLLTEIPELKSRTRCPVDVYKNTPSALSISSNIGAGFVRLTCFKNTSLSPIATHFAPERQQMKRKPAIFSLPIYGLLPCFESRWPALSLQIQVSV